MSGTANKAAGAQKWAEKGIECRELRVGPAGTYEVYWAPSAALAKEFLREKSLPDPDAHIIVETPEGNWCADSEGIYLERLLPFQTSIEMAQCRGRIKAPPKALGLKMAALGLMDNFTADVKCGRCGNTWIDGLRYRDNTLVKCSRCRAMNLVDSKRHIFRFKAHDALLKSEFPKTAVHARED